VGSGSSSSGPMPSALLEGVEWVFRGPAFADRAAFEAAVGKFQNPEWGSDWRPNEAVLNAARVRIVPDADWWAGDDEPVANLTADDGRAFTAGELLFKVHNAFVAGLREAGHQFFEGFSLAADPGAGEPPLYVVELGS
jgi:hypothetical protein